VTSVRQATGETSGTAATGGQCSHRMCPSTTFDARGRRGSDGEEGFEGHPRSSSTSWRIPGIQHKLAASAKATSVAQMARVRRRRRLGSAGRTSIRSAQVKRWDADLAGAQRRAAAMPLRRSNVGMTLRRSNLRKPKLIRHEINPTRSMCVTSVPARQRDVLAEGLEEELPTTREPPARP